VLLILLVSVFNQRSHAPGSMLLDTAAVRAEWCLVECVAGATAVSPVMLLVALHDHQVSADLARNRRRSVVCMCVQAVIAEVVCACAYRQLLICLR
jgi:hypothetical protein